MRCVVVVDRDRTRVARSHRIARADDVLHRAFGADQDLQRALDALKRMEQRNAVLRDLAEPRVELGRVAEVLLQDMVAPLHRTRRLRGRRHDDDAPGVGAAARLGDQRQAVLRDERLDARARTGVVRARQRWRERQIRASIANSWLVHLSFAIAAIARVPQSSRLRRSVTPVAQAGEPLDVLVAAWHDEVRRLARDDVEHATLEARRIVGNFRREIDGVEREQRGLVRHVAGRDQPQAVAPCVRATP